MTDSPRPGEPTSDAPSAGAPLPAVGRATRFACDGGELWRLPLADERVATRLVELGRAGVGGFTRAGRDDMEHWLVRAASRDLDAWLGEHAGPVGARVAVPMLAALAEAAAACEKRSLFPGAFEHAQLVVRDDRLEPRADALVHAMVGARTVEATPPKWMPPEAAGRPADNASNRYAIGLVGYRLITGEHPFAGRGLRLGLEDQAARGAPPFSSEIAAPAGLQSLCLRLLDPDTAKRPPNAAAIASAFRELARRIGATRATERADLISPISACHAFAADSATGLENDIAQSTPARSTTRSRSTPPASSIATTSSTTPTRPRRGFAALATIAPLGIGVVLAIVAITKLDTPEAARAVTAAPTKPIVEPRELSDCASCHPRQSAEWSRSVMAHAIESPLFQSLEMVIEEQVGRDRNCPNGAGILRAAGPNPCVNPRTGIAVTGSGGALWCVNCHGPGENLAAAMPAWDARSGDARSRRPLRDLLPPRTMEGISCAACHQMTGPVRPGAEATGRYEGNPSWVSTDTGARFLQRPEDQRGVFGIANSGYSIDPRAMVGSTGELVPGGAHRRVDANARAYQRSSEFCGACHDVRLFGSDSLSGEHFKRLRNAYSEWATWASDERRAGRKPASCQDCHMSLYPGVCEQSPAVPAPKDDPSRAVSSADLRAKGGCPTGTVFAKRAPGSYPSGSTAVGSKSGQMSTHYFSGVDVPLSRVFDPAAVDDGTLDVAGIPIGARQRRDLLLASTFRFAIDEPRRDGNKLEIPIVVENVGAGHRVPAGFSQEREIWVHLRVIDARGRLVYEVGRVDRGDQDLRDKIFLRVTTRDPRLDRQGRPLGMFGADIADGPDVPRWSAFGRENEFRGRGLVNFQNGFLRCVRCIGILENNVCKPGPGQEAKRADRYADGDYDIDTGACRSNLTGDAALFETYFPIGALDATRGIAKGPDAIVDTRSLPPNKPARYVYDLDLGPAGAGPFTVEATLEFRAFPPFLIRGFIDYETEQARLGLRPSGPLVDRTVLDRLDVVHVATASAVIP